MTLNVVHHYQGIYHDRDIHTVQSLCHFQTPTHSKRFCQTGRRRDMLFLCSLKEGVALSSFDDATPRCLTIEKATCIRKSQTDLLCTLNKCNFSGTLKIKILPQHIASDFMHQTDHISRNLQQLELFLLEHQLVRNCFGVSYPE